MENITFSDLTTKLSEINSSWFTDVDIFTENVTLTTTKTVLPSSKDASLMNLKKLMYFIFQKYGSLVFLGLGLIVNILIIIVMNRKHIRSSVMSIYFTALAGFDLIIVVLFLIRQWSIFFETGKHIPSTNLAACILLKFGYHFVVTASHYVYTIVAIERFLVVAFPLKASQFSSKKRAIVNMTGTTLLAIVVNVNQIFMAGITTGRKHRFCHVRPRYQYFEEHFQFSLMVCLQSYIPMVIIIIFNCMITIKLAQAGRKRRQYLTGNREQSEGNNVKRYTTTALAICVVFSLVVCGSMTLALNKRLNPSRFNPILGYVSNFIQAFRPSLSFFIYICTSGSIRDQFIQMICRRSKPKVRKIQDEPVTPQPGATELDM